MRHELTPLTDELLDVVRRTFAAAPIHFALWNAIQWEVDRGREVVLTLNLDKIAPLVERPPSHCGLINLTGDPRKLGRFASILRSGEPVEPIQVFMLNGRPATPGEKQIWGVDWFEDHVEFVDGRHRYAFFRMLQRRTIVASVPIDQRAWFRTFEWTVDDGPPDSLVVQNPALRTP